MNKIKRILGLVLMLIGPVVIYFLVHGAIVNIDPEGGKEIHNPVIWIIIISIFTPISIGLVIFGWYAWKGDYDKLPARSSEIS